MQSNGIPCIFHQYKKCKQQFQLWIGPYKSFAHVEYERHTQSIRLHWCKRSSFKFNCYHRWHINHLTIQIMIQQMPLLLFHVLIYLQSTLGCRPLVFLLLISIFFSLEICSSVYAMKNLCPFFLLLFIQPTFLCSHFPPAFSKIQTYSSTFNNGTEKTKRKKRK